MTKIEIGNKTGANLSDADSTDCADWNKKTPAILCVNVGDEFTSSFFRAGINPAPYLSCACGYGVNALRRHHKPECHRLRGLENQETEFT